jgi:hypothetical protein
MTLTLDQKTLALSQLGIEWTRRGDDLEIHGDTPTDEQLADAYAQHGFTLLRAERNRLLAACDWTVLADTPTSTASWKAYRQELRDLPANTTDPLNPVWPTPPA